MSSSDAVVRDDASAPWYSGLTPRHWRILWGSYLGWIFDGYEAVALVYALGPALNSILTPEQAQVKPYYIGLAIGITLLGWGFGGLLGGIAADYIGRKRMMMLSRHGVNLRVRVNPHAVFAYACNRPPNTTENGEPYWLERDSITYYSDFKVTRHALRQGENHLVNAQGLAIFVLELSGLLNGDDDGADWDAANDNAEELARLIEQAPDDALEEAPATACLTTPTGFLQKLRPGGPWVPTAIVPDSGRTPTITAHTLDEVEVFVREHNGKANLYYSVNPTRTAMYKKAAKTDIAAIEYLLGDLDPTEKETSEAAKTRYLKQLNGAFEPKPTAAVDSGNGIQGLWRLEPPIVLGELVDGKFSAEDQAKIDDAEARSACLMKRLGAKAGTQNIDRILRLPGTTNLPNEKKRREGRVECQTRLLWFNGASYPLEAFPRENSHDPANTAKSAVEADDDDDRDESGSGYGFRFMQDCHDRKMSYQEACAAILVDNTKAGEWANRVDERQLSRAWENSKPEMPPKPGQKLPPIVELGSKLWGTPTRIGKEFWFGADQSKVIDPGKGAWFDFTTHKGGQLRELMKKVAAAANREQPNADDVVVVCAADVVMRPLDWVWEGHLLRGSQELMSGLPDLSKSTVQIGYIACATARLPWPDGAPAIEPMNVIMLTAEDTLDQIVVPRLRAAGADVSRVKFLKCIKTDEHDRQFLLAEDLDRLESLVRKLGNVGLITIDPITAYMGGKMDSYKATEVRSQLGPLKDFSERMNIALSTITHPPKSAGQRALDHFIASQAFIAACRVGHLCVAEMEEKDGVYVPTRRILFTNVRNTAYRQLMPTLAYRKEEVIVGTVEQGFERPVTAPKIIWEGSVDITADAAVAAASGKKSDLQPKVQAWLHDLLKDGKPVARSEIEEAAGVKGFTEKQLRTAREKLSVHVFKEPGKMDGKWLWQLPNPAEEKYYY